MLKLWLITHIDDDGENRDLFVWADSPEDAVVSWDGYWYQDDGSGVAMLPATVTVRPVPTIPVRGAVDWDHIARLTISM